MPSMSRLDQPAGKYGWLDDWAEGNLGEALTVTVAGIDSPEAFLSAIGARSLPAGQGTLRGVTALADGNTARHVLVGVIPAPGKHGWVLAAESPSHVGYLKAGELSANGEAAALYSTEDGGVSFAWAKSGIVLAEFSPTHDDASAIDGSDPQALAEVMHLAGIGAEDTAHPRATAATLIEAITGVAITRDILENATFTAGSVPMPYW